MRFKIVKTKQATKEYESLTDEQKNAVDFDYSIISQKGIEFVKRRHLQEELFEIKTNEIRSLFEYEEDLIIIVGLIYVKKTQKAPSRLLQTAKKRIREYKKNEVCLCKGF